ncbi:MAG: bifunctional precorrin-2 dehydrogenase/sirohydrochlorin ferrochelatase [Deltaproteobacteria bacterium]|nr:bifunctional precorrin-2 dehydrogenase/sirohydrochlorin ferrochelatase [Deltaproteobacteria bacterium]
MDLYPLFLRLNGRRVVVVGAGSVGARKIGELCAAGADVLVVAQEATAEVGALAERGEIALVRRAFADSDLDGAWLVIAATNDTQVNRAIAAAAEARRLFCNAVDDPPNASAFFGAVLRRPPFLVAISSSGELPALSRLLRVVLESALPEERWIVAARALRTRWKAEGTPMGERFAELVRAIAEPISGETKPRGA